MERGQEGQACSGGAVELRRKRGMAVCPAMDESVEWFRMREDVPLKQDIKGLHYCTGKIWRGKMYISLQRMISVLNLFEGCWGKGRGLRFGGAGHCSRLLV